MYSFVCLGYCEWGATWFMGRETRDDLIQQGRAIHAGTGARSVDIVSNTVILAYKDASSHSKWKVIEQFTEISYTPSPM